jgi:RNA polymerase sigma-70 factor (ECF subfamily)
VDELAETVRIDGTRILATLVRAVGSLQLAEDAVQEALVSALSEWPRAGMPDQPRAWLTVTARRKAVDILRREQARAGKEREGVQLAELLAPDPPSDSTLRDDQLRLIFTCCHPALAPEARVALALRVLCGLSTRQIASVLQVGEPAVAKRLTRTRQKIAAARIPYRVPDDADLPERLGAVCGVVHGLYTIGHAPVGGPGAYDLDVCGEAVRLARLLRELLPDEPMPAAVLALLLFTDARRPARVGPDGDVVLLADQDRSTWDTSAIAEAEGLLAASLGRTAGVADPYQLQAAIAAEHARAGSYEDTDWAEVVRLYDLLVSVAPSPAAALARAVAVAEAHGAAAGLSALDGVPPGPRWHAVRGELLARQGRYAEAVNEAAASVVGELTAPERRHRERRLALWTATLEQRDQ